MIGGVDADGRDLSSLPMTCVHAGAPSAPNFVRKKVGKYAPDPTMAPLPKSA